MDSAGSKSLTQWRFFSKKVAQIEEQAKKENIGSERNTYLRPGIATT